MEQEQFNEMDEILLVYDDQQKKVAAVKGIDPEGNLQTVPAQNENQNEFLKINKQGDPLENFISNFNSQLKNPTRFHFFPVRIPLVEKTAAALRKKIQANTAENKQPLNNQANINPQKQKNMENTTTSGTEQTYRFNPEKIDWNNLKKFGITQENLSEKTLENMLKGNKSNELHRIYADFGNVKLQTEARLSFRNMPDGSVALAIHGVRRQPELDREFFGYKFTDEDKKNLLETGNLGRLVEVKYPNNPEPNLVYISMDKLTNELVSLKADHVRLPEEIKGVKLNEEQKQALHEGKAVYVEDMTSKVGTQFSAHIQINADKRGLEFRFDDTQKQQVFIPQKIGGVEITQEQQKDLREGKTIYVKDMVNKEGKPYSTYVKVDNENRKLAFYKNNPDTAQKQGKKSETHKKVSETSKKNETQKPESGQKPKGRKL